MNYDIMNVGEYYTQVNEPKACFLFNSVRIYKNMHIAYYKYRKKNGYNDATFCGSCEGECH